MLDNDLGSKYLLQLIFTSFLGTDLKLLLLLDPLVKQVCTEYPLYLLGSNPFPELLQLPWVNLFAELCVQKHSWLLWHWLGLYLHHNLIDGLSVGVYIRLISEHHISAEPVATRSPLPATLLPVLLRNDNRLLFAVSGLERSVHERLLFTFIEER